MQKHRITDRYIGKRDEGNCKNGLNRTGMISKELITPDIDDKTFVHLDRSKGATCFCFIPAVMGLRAL